jgi:Spy/CpxP family protein refolding chaperone
MRAALVLAALLLASQATYAQAPPEAPHRQSTIEALTRELNLSETQKVQVTKIFDAERVKRDAERARVKASGQEATAAFRHAKMRELEQDLQKQMSRVLTAQQLQKFKQFEQEHRHHHAPDDGLVSSPAR